MLDTTINGMNTLSELSTEDRNKLQFINDLNTLCNKLIDLGGMEAVNSLSFNYYKKQGYKISDVYEDLVYMVDDKAYKKFGVEFAIYCLGLVTKRISGFTY